MRSRFVGWLVLATTMTVSPLLWADQVNVYSARKEALIKPLLDQFSKKEGVKVKLVTGSGDALLARLRSEGKLSPADLLITTDVGRLHRAEEAGVLQAIDDAPWINHVPENYRDANGYWFGLSLRSRVIVYAPDRVKESDLSTYEDLASPKWRGKVCIRSSSNIYNQSLVASFIAHEGQEVTEAWLKAFIKNFARPPQGGDKDQVKAVAAGQCDVAIVNSYYLGAMLTSDDADERAVAEKVKLFWPNQNGRGTHMNVSGVGLTQSAKHKATAMKLIAFLLSDEAQAWYAKVNNEYPVRDDISMSEILSSWGDFKADTLAVEKLGEYNAAAVKAMDRAAWK